VKHEIAIPNPEQTPDELLRSKRIADRAVLLDHIDHILRPPAWVYEEIEEASGTPSVATSQPRSKAGTARATSPPTLSNAGSLTRQYWRSTRDHRMTAGIGLGQKRAEPRHAPRAVAAI